MTRDELHDRLRRAAAWGGVIGLAAALAFSAWAVATDGRDAGSIVDFLSLMVMTTLGGACLFTMLVIKWTSWAELRGSIGHGRAAAYMAVLFVAVVALMFVTNALAMRY